MAKFCSIAKELDFTEFPRVDGARLKHGKLMKDLDNAMHQDIPRLLEGLPGMTKPGGGR